MSVEAVTEALDRVERLLNERPDGDRTVQPSLRALQDDADIQLRKACSLLNACRTLRRRRGSYVPIVELSFNAVERSFQHYLTDTTSADSSQFHTHERVYEEMAGKNVFGGAGVVERIDAIRQRNRAAMYYDVRKPTREQASAIVEFAQATHDHLVALGRHQPLCGCHAGS
jgi:hypothetical protein